jgi:type II secretory pathway pseudopilin PulG
MFTYLETAIAFTLVILVASLMVNILVRIYDTVFNERAKGVQAMLRQLFRGYARTLGLKPPPKDEDAFVHAVLSAPILHDAASYDELVEASPGKALVKLHASIEYLLVDDLVAIVKDVDKPTVKAWFQVADLDPANPKVVPENVRDDLIDYINKWFKTAAATAANRFGKLARRRAMSVAAIVVVLLNLDAIRLAYDLYRDRALTERVEQHVEDMTETAKRLLETDETTPDDRAQLQADLQKAAALFSIERIPIGWNDAYISKRWCAYQGRCNDPAIARPSRGALALDGAYWLLGLFVSWLLLSLGAPFWVRALETLTGIRNRLKPPRGKAPGSSPWPEEKEESEPGP